MAKTKKARLTKGVRKALGQDLAIPGPLENAVELRCLLADEKREAREAREAAVSRGDPYELIRKLQQIHAATIQISGGGFESFDELNDELKDSYLIMLSDLAQEALDVARKYTGHLGGR